MLDLKERDRKILEAVIQDYIQTAEPVGSRALGRRHHLDISPATIRNTMADLEDLGLLTQPHTSAGRIPTELGLRFYVDTILEVRGITGLEQKVIDREFDGINHKVEQIVRRSSRVLSSISRHIGIVLAPKLSRMTLKQVQFIKINSSTLMAILVGRSGMIQNRIINVEEDLGPDDLERFNRYLNDILEGLTIQEIKTRIVEEMREEKNRFDNMLARALELSRRVFNDDELLDDVYVDGQVNLLDWPEFSDVVTMKAIFQTFEDKSILVRLLDSTLNASGVQIFIGSETELAGMEGCTLIASRYSRDSRPLGTLGVIGPTRLNYSKIIPVVDYTAQLVTRMLDSNP